MNYREEANASKKNKQAYLAGLERLIRERQQEAAEKRSAYFQNIPQNGARFREDLREMLGWPLVGYTPAGLPAVKAERLAEERGYTVYRLELEVLEGLTLSGLYFERQGGAHPLVLVQHGGLGTPELIAGLYGSTANYNDMLERVIAQGVHAFAPQLVLWDKSYDVPFERAHLDGALKRVGSSVAAVELFALMRVLDHFEVQENVSSLGMVGMSYGGFYTLYLAALDTRIRAAVSCAFFNTRDAYPWPDWTWHRSAEKFDDAEVACLVWPRKLCIEIAEGDPLFAAESGKRSFERLTALCEASGMGTDWVRLVPFAGNHEFCKDDAPLAALAEALRA